MAKNIQQNILQLTQRGWKHSLKHIRSCYASYELLDAFTYISRIEFIITANFVL